MKILFISNIIGKGVGSFSAASIAASKDLGLEFHMAANFNNSTFERMKSDEQTYGIRLHHIDFIRKPYALGNIKAYKQVVKLINDERFDIVHCNTPIGGVIGRLASKKCKVKTVIYQAHGLHFYSGAPIRNWLLYYPIEKWLAHYTDVLITINHEDYQTVQKSFHLRNNGKVYYVPGVGIDLSNFKKISENSRETIREEFDFQKNDIVCISAGDLVARKNHSIAIKAIALTKRNDIHYLICGSGPEKDELDQLANKLGIKDNIHFLGYRSDVLDLYQGSDIFLFSSLQEGLPRSTMEAMASGLPVVCSRIRGNTDLIEDGLNGFLCDPMNPSEFSNAILLLSDNCSLRREISENNLSDIKKFSLESVSTMLKDIYLSVIDFT